jgi:selenocysteine lyase/cysteine desulfurase
VQYAPHGPIDVQRLGCDFLVCSAYKFFGPHLGLLYGRYELLEQLPAYRVRPAPALPPEKFETGTAAFEAICGLLGALEYLQSIGQKFGQEQAELYQESYSGRALLFKQAMSAVRAYEFELSRALLDSLTEMPGVKLYGPADERRLEQRVPTFSFTLAGKSPAEVAERLGRQGINIWSGNFYALAVTQRLGLEEQGGLIRVGAVHYNTLEEIERFRQALGEIAAG